MTRKSEQKQDGPASMAGVLKRFPEYRSTLEGLWSSDADFQNLCDEYQDCAAAFGYWQQSPSAEASSLRNEYAALLQDLEEEILSYLESQEQERESSTSTAEGPEQKERCRPPP